MPRLTIVVRQTIIYLQSIGVPPQQRCLHRDYREIFDRRYRFYNYLFVHHDRLGGMTNGMMIDTKGPFNTKQLYSRSQVWIIAL